MSAVTNIILTFSLLEREEERIAEVNTYLRDHGTELGPSLYGNTDAYGGTKMFVPPFYVAAFSNFDLDAFLDALRGIDWDESELVQVIVQGNDERRFRIIHPFELPPALLNQRVGDLAPLAPT